MSCPKCKLPLAGKPNVNAMGKRWHSECFVCTECDKNLLKSGGFQALKEMPYCVECYKAKLAPKCDTCKGPAIPPIAFQVGDQNITLCPKCFKCDSCSAQLDIRDPKSYKFFQNKFLCPKDFDALLPQCKKCNKGVQSGGTRALGAIWHTECFKCIDCGGDLENFFNKKGFPACDTCIQKTIDDGPPVEEETDTSTLAIVDTEFQCFKCKQEFSGGSSYLTLKVPNKTKTQVLKRYYHQTCLGCDRCGSKLDPSSPFFQLDGEIVCPKCQEKEEEDTKAKHSGILLFKGKNGWKRRFAKLSNLNLSIFGLPDDGIVVNTSKKNMRALIPLETVVSSKFVAPEKKQGPTSSGSKSSGSKSKSVLANVDEFELFHFQFQISTKNGSYQFRAHQKQDAEKYITNLVKLRDEFLNRPKPKPQQDTDTTPQKANLMQDTMNKQREKAGIKAKEKVSQQQAASSATEKLMAHEEETRRQAEVQEEQSSMQKAREASSLLKSRAQQKKLGEKRKLGLSYRHALSAAEDLPDQFRMDYFSLVTSTQDSKSRLLDAEQLLDKYQHEQDRAFDILSNAWFTLKQFEDSTLTKAAVPTDGQYDQAFTLSKGFESRIRTFITTLKTLISQEEEQARLAKKRAEDEKLAIERAEQEAKHRRDQSAAAEARAEALAIKKYQDKITTLYQKAASKYSDWFSSVSSQVDKIEAAGVEPLMADKTDLITLKDHITSGQFLYSNLSESHSELEDEGIPSEDFEELQETFLSLKTRCNKLESNLFAAEEERRRAEVERQRILAAEKEARRKDAEKAEKEAQLRRAAEEEAAKIAAKAIKPKVATEPASSKVATITTPPSTAKGSILNNTPESQTSSEQDSTESSSGGNVLLVKDGKWSAFRSPDNRIYFFNSSTGKTRWKKPKKFTQDVPGYVPPKKKGDPELDARFKANTQDFVSFSDQARKDMDALEDEKNTESYVIRRDKMTALALKIPEELNFYLDALEEIDEEYKSKDISNKNKPTFDDLVEIYDEIADSAAVVLTNLMKLADAEIAKEKKRLAAEEKARIEAEALIAEAEAESEFNTSEVSPTKTALDAPTPVAPTISGPNTSQTKNNTSDTTTVSVVTNNPRKGPSLAPSKIRTRRGLIRERRNSSLSLIAVPRLNFGKNKQFPEPTPDQLELAKFFEVPTTDTEYYKFKKSELVGASLEALVAYVTDDAPTSEEVALRRSMSSTFVMTFPAICPVRTLFFLIHARFLTSARQRTPKIAEKIRKTCTLFLCKLISTHQDVLMWEYDANLFTTIWNFLEMVKAQNDSKVNAAIGPARIDLIKRHQRALELDPTASWINDFLQFLHIAADAEEMGVLILLSSGHQRNLLATQGIALADDPRAGVLGGITSRFASKKKSKKSHLSGPTGNPSLVDYGLGEIMQKFKFETYPRIAPGLQFCPKGLRILARRRQLHMSKLTSGWNFLKKYSPYQIASELTLMDHELYCEIQYSELLGQAWNDRKRRNELAPTVCDFIRRFDHVAHWAVTELLCCHKLNIRVKLLKFFLNICLALEELNSYNCLLALMAGLANSAVVRLYQTWQEVPEELDEEFRRLENITAASGSWKKYRDEIGKLLPGVPSVPFLGVFLTDLTFLDDGNPDFLSDPETKETTHFINLDKLRRVTKVLREFHEFKRAQFVEEQDPNTAQRKKKRRFGRSNKVSNKLVRDSLLREYLLYRPITEDDEEHFTESRIVEPPEELFWDSDEDEEDEE